MAMRLWASSTVNALNLCRGNGARTTILPTFSIYRRFSSVLDGFKYNSSHEWVKHDGSVATIGITNHAQGHLGEVVFVELPESGSPVSKGGSFGAIESVKVTSDVNSPILGEVVEVNTKLTQAPGLISSNHYEDGWMIKVRPSSPVELEALLGPGEYAKFCEEEDDHH